jgi:LPXTG-motif cell wall-anchored protein
MRILGILLILFSLVSVSWGGYVEFVYIADGKAKFAEQMEQAEVKFNASIDQAEEKYKKRLDEISSMTNLSDDYKTSMTESAEQMYQQAKQIGQESFEKGKEMMQSGLDRHVSDIRAETMSIYALIGGLLLLVFGAFLTFRRKA